METMCPPCVNVSILFDQGTNLAVILILVEVCPEPPSIKDSLPHQAPGVREFLTLKLPASKRFLYFSPLGPAMQRSLSTSIFFAWHQDASDQM